MRNFTLLLFLLLFSISVFPQKRKPVKKTANPPKAASAVKPAAVGDEKEEFEKAVDHINAAARLAALQKFVRDFPDAANKNGALELIVVARAQIADEKFGAGDAAGGAELFKLAVREAPKPVSDKLFAGILLQIPNNLYFRGNRAAAEETAALIEEKAAGNAKQLLGLATFYLGAENADGAKKLADKAAALEPNLPAAYQVAGLANRLNFNLEEAANDYSKALELDANSTVSKRGLAELKRALGKSDEAVALYREILAKDEKDAGAKNGLILSLFDAGKQTEAEAETQKSLAQNPNNLPLLVGAAYWYAANNNGAKAVELAQKAVAAEPRYVWSYIALARGFERENRFAEAERALISARAYGNFPTLDYELASARLAAGFYREAARDLSKTFAVKDDSITTKLGGRVEKQAKTFVELLAPERRASIFEPLAADNIENAQRLKSLLDFYQKLEKPDAISDAEISEAADKFTGGADKMRIHRQLFAAGQLLEKKKLLPKVAELMKSATGAIDDGLNVPNAAPAVLADELFESRSLAFAKNETIVVPDVPRRTLSNILRGRIEETVGWAFYQEDKLADAVVHLKRAVGILPEKTAWRQTSLWHLGAALQAEAKPREALDAYIKSYTDGGEPNAARRIVIEALYNQVNGSLDGLDALIGAKNETAAAYPISTARLPEKNEAIAVQTDAAQIPKPETLPKSESTPQTIEKTAQTTEVPAEVEQKPLPTPEVKLDAEIIAPKIIEPKTEPTPEIKEANPEPTPEIIEPAVKENTENKENKEITPETKPPETTKLSPVENNSEKSQKPLFEPIIITVPKRMILPNPKTNAPAAVEEKTPDSKIVESAETADAPEKPTVDKTVGSGNTRPRVVFVDNTATAGNAPKCEITVSQENISLLNNGGNLGVLVGFENDASEDAKKITAASSSPQDVEVVFEPAIGAQLKRAFFVVRSVSAKTGIFTVVFESACGGRREILVKVR